VDLANPRFWALAAAKEGSTNPSILTDEIVALPRSIGEIVADILSRPTNPTVSAKQVVAGAGALSDILVSVRNKLYRRVIISKTSTSPYSHCHALLQLSKRQLCSDASSKCIWLSACTYRARCESLLFWG
jgi:hypothetical protein